MNVNINFNKIPRCNFLLDYDIIDAANLNKSEYDLAIYLHIQKNYTYRRLWSWKYRKCRKFN